MARKKRDKAAADEAVAETQESPALDAEAGGEIRFAREDIEAVGDPAAASIDSEPEPFPEPEPTPEPDSGPSWTKLGSGTAAGESAADEPVADEVPVAEAPVGEPPMGESPAEADRRAAGEAAGDGSPVGAVLGAFVGAFVAAKVLGRFGGGED